MRGVRRKIDFGCLVIMTIIMTLFICSWLFAQEPLRLPRQQQLEPETLRSSSYLVEYRADLRIPISADWHLCAADIGKSKREPSWKFSEDTRVAQPRATHEDYTKTGYDRGHMVPAADRSANISSMMSTFIMTNVCPQVPSLNRGPWKRLENACRSYVLNCAPVRVHVDAVFWHADTQRIGSHAVAVPHGFVKSVYSSPQDSLLYSRYFQNF